MGCYSCPLFCHFTKGKVPYYYITYKRIKMSKKYMLDAKGLTAMTSNLKEIINTKSVSLSMFAALVGLGIIILSSWIEDKSSSSYMAGNTLAIVLLIWGFYRLLFKRSQLLYLPTNSNVLSGSFYFDTKHLDKLKNVVIDNQETDFSQYEFVKSGNSRLDYVVSKDGQFVAVQLFQYVPYTFEPASEVICYENGKAKNFGQFLLDNHGKI